MEQCNALSNALTGSHSILDNIIVSIEDNTLPESCFLYQIFSLQAFLTGSLFENCI